LTREDALFWTDWVVSATATLIGTTFIAVNKATPVPFSVWLGAVASLLASCVTVPFLLRVFAYEPATGRMKTDIRWMVLANTIGLANLLAAVATGVKIYDFT
jgi:hypothetical protein